MKRTLLLIFSMILSIASVSTVVSSSDWGERDDDDHDHHYESGEQTSDRKWRSVRPDVMPADNALYREECGSCHFAYQPGLMPAKDWRSIMASLQQHFGDDASLAQQQADRIRDYLVQHAANRAGQSRARAFAAGMGHGEGLPRITTGRYFRHEHYEVPTRFVTGNPDVGSFSNCPACHVNAGSGIYNEHQVNIPGYGRWDD